MSLVINFNLKISEVADLEFSESPRVIYKEYNSMENKTTI